MSQGDTPAAAKSSTTEPRTVHETSPFLTSAQLKAELTKCEFCEEKPCREACPSHCSPADFIRAAQVGLPSDIKRAAAEIMTRNPLGGICGMVCPDHHCMAACVHKKLDGAVDIPQVQATLIQRAKEIGGMPALSRPEPTGRRVAVVGGGPAGLAAAAMLSQRGHGVTLFERDERLGGMCHCIPGFRLEKSVLETDIQWLIDQTGVEVELGSEVETPAALLEAGYDAVVVATGLWTPIRLGIPGEDAAIAATDFLKDPDAWDVSGHVAVIGGGATAYDCAVTAKAQGAARVEMFALETLSEMPLSEKEMKGLVASGVDVDGRTQVTEIHIRDGEIGGLATRKVTLPAGTPFHPRQVVPIPGSETRRNDIDTVIIAIGLRSSFPKVDDPRVVYAGDCAEGPTTVVEASASGKNAADMVEAIFDARPRPSFPRNRGGYVKSRTVVPGYDFRPVSLEADFFGRPIATPFLLSAAPPTDGIEQMRKAYAAGWSGGIMKTAFDGVPIHIPERYMFTFDRNTYANCDNVSGHALDRVCREIEQLVQEFPDRLTLGSTGGPVTGDDEADARQWQGNSRKLEDAGAMGIEFSLSCPQGGDGTEGDIVSQNAELTAKIIEWVLSAGDGSVPKLFKLTGAVTSVASIVSAAREVFRRYPDKKAGITLANSFPTLAFRPGEKPTWEEGIIVGASGAGILNISFLSLAKVAHLGVTISGNGGPMDYKAAADFLALGAKTVQFCTIAMKYGYGIIDDLTSGLSHLMADRGIHSVADLIGIALPDPVTDFMDLSPFKKVSAPSRELCLRCGNCARCPYLAISLDEDGFPITDPSRCVGCGICALKCFAMAIDMRDRTPEEAAALKED